MTETPFGQIEGLRIGSVDFVSPDEIKVLLDIEAPESVALNAGGARPFPRVNGYVLIPVEESFLVGQIEWLTIERSAFPKRRGVQDFGLIDLPYPLRKVSLSPLGTMRKRMGSQEAYDFRRGADALPGVGTAVLLPSDRQLKAIIESGSKRRVRIGTSPLGGDAEVSIDPDRLFGRHVAVLGNTGSGKSCSVAGLIRWALEGAKSAIPGDARPNARFIVLDPNGEYGRAFAEPVGGLQTRVLRVGGDDPASALKVPMWLWNSAEWMAFTKASAKTQRPTLLQALRIARDGATLPAVDQSHELRRFLRTMTATIRVEKHTGSPWGQFPRPKAFFEKLEKWRNGLQPELATLAGAEHAALQKLLDAIDPLLTARRVQYPNWDFTRQEVDSVLDAASSAHAAFGGSPADTLPVDADAPRRFTPEAILQAVEAAAEALNVTEHVETLIIRLRGLLGDAQMRSVIVDDGTLTLEDVLKGYLPSSSRDCSLAIIDLSLVPSEIVHIVTSVIARLVFEALQRHRRRKGEVLPTVLVMEEAHTFVKKYGDETDSPEVSAVCCQVFERIAREGRKFGLGLVVSSQRPSELSPTVLSQCNTFLLHRISNDRDQELVHRFVPDSLRSLLRELPSLPSQYAILLGWASEIPVLVRMNFLPKNQRPQSEDPDFWNVWTGKDDTGCPVLRPTEWPSIASDWQGTQGTEDGN